MPLEDILHAMESDASAEREVIFANARQEADRVTERARTEAEAAGARRLETELRALRSEQARRLNDARLAGLRQVALRREGLLGQAFDAAAAEIGALRTRGEYPEVFRRLLMEAAEELPDQLLAVRVDPRDQELASAQVREQGLDASVSAGLSCAGGLEVATSDGQVIVRNTVEHRLARAREALREDLLAAIHETGAGLRQGQPQA
jgi:vacuolar-type H+-ATPase subunit E/Vma4